VDVGLHITAEDLPLVGREGVVHPVPFHRLVHVPVRPHAPEPQRPAARHAHATMRLPFDAQTAVIYSCERTSADTFRQLVTLLCSLTCLLFSKSGQVCEEHGRPSLSPEPCSFDAPLQPCKSLVTCSPERISPGSHANVSIQVWPVQGGFLLRSLRQRHCSVRFPSYGASALVSAVASASALRPLRSHLLQRSQIQINQLLRKGTILRGFGSPGLQRAAGAQSVDYPLQSWQKHNVQPRHVVS